MSSYDPLQKWELEQTLHACDACSTQFWKLADFEKYATFKDCNTSNNSQAKGLQVAPPITSNATPKLVAARQKGEVGAQISALQSRHVLSARMAGNHGRQVAARLMKV